MSKGKYGKAKRFFFFHFKATQPNKNANRNVTVKMKGKMLSLSKATENLMKTPRTFHYQRQNQDDSK